mmetsp:Transcript_13123/g.40399  ORF Transcript_13123/g.40399 Transcript_13123/m.40399 type:complete len:84 (+) Transcript_13123:330-581(+)
MLRSVKARITTWRILLVVGALSDPTKNLNSFFVGHDLRDSHMHVSAEQTEYGHRLTKIVPSDHLSMKSVPFHSLNNFKAVSHR